MPAGLAAGQTVPVTVMSRHFLRPGVHGVQIGADLVLLDTLDDAYLCLPDLPPDVLLGRRVVDGEAIDRLAQEGLLEAQERPHPYRDRPIPAAPTEACRPQREGRANGSMFAALAGSWCRTHLSPSGIAAHATAVSDRRGRLSATEGERLVVAFRNALPLFPNVGACLFQARWLLEFLGPNAGDVDWVFGVRLRPFAAHCWLQHREVALTDPPDALLCYHPLLAI